MAVSAAAATMPMWLEITVSVLQSLGAVVAVGVAVYAIRRSEREFDEVRQSNRVAKAFQIFEELGSNAFRESVENADDAITVFKRMKVAGDLDENFLPNYSAPIHLVLNRLEKFSLEINHRISDEKIARSYFGKTLHNYWIKYRDYVIWYRQTVGNPTAYTAAETIPKLLIEK